MTLQIRNSFPMTGNYTSRRNGHWPGGAIPWAFQQGGHKGAGQRGKPQERAAPREIAGCPGGARGAVGIPAGFPRSDLEKSNPVVHQRIAVIRTLKIISHSRETDKFSSLILTS